MYNQYVTFSISLNLGANRKNAFWTSKEDFGVFVLL